MIKTKGFRLTIYILLAVMLISCFSVLVYVIEVSKKGNDSKNVEATYDFGSGAITDDESSNYKSNQYFEISSLSEFNNFSTSVAAGLDFFGKIVSLTGDVSGGHGSEIKPVGLKLNSNGNYSGAEAFRGTFDGQGHVISNVYFTLSGTAIGTEVDKVGLFSILGSNACVRNVGIKWFYLTMYDATFVTFYVGGIAGQVYCDVENQNATITNCMIDGLVITSYETADAIGALVGDARHKCSIAGNNDTAANSVTNKLIVSNCFVANVEVRSSPVTPTMLGPRRSSLGTSMSGCGAYSYSIEDCIVKDCGTYPLYYTSEGTIYENNDREYRSNCHTTANTTTGLDYSTTGGVSDSTWYYSSAYNNGWPVLRVFLDWKTIYFKAGAGGTIGASSIQIPSDASTSGFQNYSSRNNIEIYGRYIYAIPNDGYKVQNWTFSGDTYTVTFTARIINMHIYNTLYTYVEEKNINTGACKYSSWFSTSSTDAQYDGSFNVAYGAYIDISVTKCDKADCYSALVYKFTDISGVSWQITITTEPTRYIYFYEEDKEYLGRYKLEPYLDYEGFVLGWTSLKSYNITFG